MTLPSVSSARPGWAESRTLWEGRIHLISSSPALAVRGCSLLPVGEVGEGAQRKEPFYSTSVIVKV